MTTDCAELSSSAATLPPARMGSPPHRSYMATPFRTLYLHTAAPSCQNGNALRWKQTSKQLTQSGRMLARNRRFLRHWSPASCIPPTITQQILPADYPNLPIQPATHSPSQETSTQPPHQQRRSQRPHRAPALGMGLLCFSNCLLCFSNCLLCF